MGKRVARRYWIIAAAQEGLQIDLNDLTEDERELYDGVKKECEERRVQGLPQLMYELPMDAFEDDDE